ncbi:MAG: GntR family transcriptional regulator [Paracoccaceae bacterium]|nr:GntR family transcriptional regulator [Paracoccaceae bacterium]MDE2911704.1 GntR family transcriptional regulator [Paracoccaceae bacterium]
MIGNLQWSAIHLVIDAGQWQVVVMDKSEGDGASTQSSTLRAYLTLRNDIITGRLPPGERLKIDTLKTGLDTGASPVREALSLLTSDQLVNRIDQRGFRVAKTSRSQFQEILNLRCNLEVLAVRDSLDRSSPEWEDSLVLAHHHMKQSSLKNPESFETHHKRFHMALLDACGSPILLRFCSQLYDLNVRYRYLAGRAISYARRDVEAEHRGILDAAVNRDVDDVCARLLEHYRRTGAFLEEQMGKDSPDSSGSVVAYES